MALKSRLFAGDAKLEAAAAANPAHVVPGARGPHVAKIQCAVIRADGAKIDAGELVDERYGPSTAKAVLGYKQKRSIINRSYQSSADDIAGIMTLARLDADMLVFEAKPVAVGDIRCKCHDDEAPHPAPQARISLFIARPFPR